MKSFPTDLASLLSDLLVYMLWLGMTLWLWKISVNINREVNTESSEALRVPPPVGWLLTGRKNTTTISMRGIGGVLLTLFWFFLFAKASSFINSRYTDYVLLLLLILMMTLMIAYFTRRLIWWLKHRR